MYKIKIQNNLTSEITLGISDALPTEGGVLILKVIDSKRDGMLITPKIIQVQSDHFLTRNNKYSYAIQNI